jgi:hypothetical protein
VIEGSSCSEELVENMSKLATGHQRSPRKECAEYECHGEIQRPDVAAQSR